MQYMTMEPLAQMPQLPPGYTYGGYTYGGYAAAPSVVTLPAQGAPSAPSMAACGFVARPPAQTVPPMPQVLPAVSTPVSYPSMQTSSVFPSPVVMQADVQVPPVQSVQSAIVSSQGSAGNIPAVSSAVIETPGSGMQPPAVTLPPVQGNEVPSVTMQAQPAMQSVTIQQPAYVSASGASPMAAPANAPASGGSFVYVPQGSGVQLGGAPITSTSTAGSFYPAPQQSPQVSGSQISGIVPPHAYAGPTVQESVKDVAPAVQEPQEPAASPTTGSPKGSKKKTSSKDGKKKKKKGCLACCF